MAFPTGWARKCKITIPDAKISGNNTSFPILLTEANFPTEMLDGGDNSALNGGGDVVFTEDSPGAVQMSLDIVTFVTGGTPDVELYTKRPTLNTAAERDIWVWYKKAGEAQPADIAAYGRNSVWSDYEAVYHLNGAEGTDSAGNHNGTLINSPTSEDGPYGTAISLNGLNQRIDLGALIEDALSGVDTLTIQAWVKPTTVGIDRIISATRVTSSAGHKFWADAGGSGEGWASAVATGSIAAAGADNSDATLNVWQFVTFRYDGAILGVRKDNAGFTNTTKTGLIGDSNTQVSIGGTPNGDYFAGGLKEVRYRIAVLSDDWLTTAYNNQSDPATFATAGTPEAVSSGATIAVNGTSCSHASDSPTQTQAHNFIVNGAALAQTANSPSSTQTHSGAVNSTNHTHTANNTSLIQNQTLPVTDNTHRLISDEAGIFDPTAFTPNLARSHKATRKNRTSTPPSSDRTTHPTNTRTLRI
ncbi:MAG: hypothetical protein COB54_03565 [Alphaproteobacteria bacterium]|nr:MAG: hypothetical protein COB54_03565 [Alphaproteobacteria bacterium]